ncbi:hypothetical protein ACJ51O_38435 (plasmid) [Burkholderia pyrrocinia]|uniref:hypothetical protein n=1 Tax=Burkholderia pyrrocinia TaxID=60550 RepID=UPI0038B45650
MCRQTRRTLTVITLLVALFFSQLWVAAYACTTTSQPAAAAMSSVSTASVDGHADLRDDHAAAVCHAHCDNSGQLDHAELSVPASHAWIPLIWGASAIPDLTIQSHWPTRPELVLLSASPPPRILFQVFRI